MKRIFRTFSVFAGLILACAAFSAPVGAATLTKSFVFSNGNVLDINSYRKITLVSGVLNVTNASGNLNTTDFPDAGGVVLAKITASAGFASTWQLYNGVYYNVDHATRVFCNVSDSVIVWLATGGETISGDGC